MHRQCLVNVLDSRGVAKVVFVCIVPLCSLALGMESPEYGRIQPQVTNVSANTYIKNAQRPCCWHIIPHCTLYTTTVESALLPLFFAYSSSPLCLRRIWNAATRGRTFHRICSAHLSMIPLPWLLKLPYLRLLSFSLHPISRTPLSMEMHRLPLLSHPVSFSRPYPSFHRLRTNGVRSCSY